MATDMKKSVTNMNEVEIVALNALGFLAGEPDRFSRFLALTGLRPDDVEACAGQADFLASIIDYLMGDEKLLLEFAQDHALDPESIVKMRQKLPGRPAI
ncbi:MAG: DUF3572 domain-containing protein [Aestuariivirgaceae bacterium]